MGSSEDVGEVSGDQGVAASPPRAVPLVAPPAASPPRVEVRLHSAPPAASADTAEIPVVVDRRRRPPRGSDEWHERRRRPAPYALRLVVWLLFFVLLLVAAGRAVEQYRPAWLDFLRNVSPARSAAAPERSRPAAHPATTGAPASTAPSGFHLVSTGAKGTTYTVPSSTYRLVVTTSEPSWTQIATPAGSTTYRYAETVVPSASPKAFAVTGSSTIVVDHTVASIGVEIGTRTVGTITAPRVGYPYSFQPAAS